MILLAAVVGSLGCAGDATRPEEAGPVVVSDFYPLQIGNAWSYQYTSDVRFLNADSGALLDQLTRAGVGEVTIDRTEKIGDVTYIVERTVAVEPGQPPDTTWVRLRQDGTGLYRANLSNRLPPDGTNMTGHPAEITRLRYPLAPGTQWTVFSGPPEVSATVESFDTLQTPGGSFSAYRVGVVRSDQGANDTHHVWYGRCGTIRVDQHSELTAVDTGTGDRVRIVTDETQLALDARLTESIDCTGGE